jgi:mTERF domain-containing protein
MLTADLGCLRAMVKCAEGVGLRRGSGLFRHVLHAVVFRSEDKIAARVEFLKKACRWSDAEVGIAVSKAPALLRTSEDKLQRASEFLISEVGLLPTYTAHRPVMLLYSLEGRLRPRYYVVKFLKANGYLDHDRSYYSAVMVTEKVFVEKYICTHKDAAPHLAEDYADACKGQVPMRFRF